MASSAARARMDLVILSEPASWDQWFEETKASVPSQMWRYFDPDSDATLTELVEPVMPVDEPLLAGNEPSQARNARISRNQRLEDVYFKRFGVFRENERKWDRYHEIEAKLRERIQSTVVPQKKATLRTIYSVRQWLTALRDSTALPAETLRLNIQLEYRKLMGNTHLDCPSGGPTIWLAKWEELINKAERYNENLPTWLRDVCLVWEQVPDLNIYFSNVKLSIRKHTTAEYTPAEISSSIHFHWEHRKQHLALKPMSKPKATRSAFTARGVTLNGEEAPDVSDNPDATAVGAIIAEKPKTPPKRKRKNQNDDSDRTTNRQKRDPCTACGGLSHNFNKCYLALGQDSDLITDKALEKFQSNMKAASFRKRVDDLKKSLQSESNADE
ncbi:hypothetical protein MMC22_003227 [Lobaria immixta]|nr:hypothetical protein [Lobaria immixta]